MKSAATVFLTLFLAIGAIAQTQFDLVYPQPNPGGESTTFTLLPNGNIVLTDYEWEPAGAQIGGGSRGAAYLYNGATGLLISVITGSQPGDSVGSDIKILPNGDYLLLSSFWNEGRGAVTYCRASTGCNGVVSTANSVTGRNPLDSDGLLVTVLGNGNYVVAMEFWDGDSVADIGAVRLCQGDGSCVGQMEAANSLTGTSSGDRVGTVVEPLDDSNFVVGSPVWDGDTVQNIGAATWCDGTTGCVGTVATGNSAYGFSAGDGIGGSIVPLSGGKYALLATEYSSASGIAVFCDVAGGCSGFVQDLKYFWGNGSNNRVGDNLIELPSGAFLIVSPSWGSRRGAVTFCATADVCNGHSPSTQNSLVGSRAEDLVGLFGVTVLANGNFVVQSPVWQNSTTSDFGAATFCSGTSGCFGEVSTANSLHGESTSSQVGRIVLGLPNGNYAVVSPFWDPVSSTSNVGAVTFCSGTTGCVGAVTNANSMIGEEIGARIGEFGSTILPNGNFLIYSTNANFGGGALTLCSGTTGCPIGGVNETNSLVGNTNERIDNDFQILDNSDYVVPIPDYDRNTGEATGGSSVVDVGAVKYCSGTSGCTGFPSDQDAISGTNAGDRVGSRIRVVGNNYIVASPEWDDAKTADAGAITLCGGNNDCTDTNVSVSNSIIGTDTFGSLGNGGIRQVGENFAVVSLGFIQTNSNAKLGGGVTQPGVVTFVDGLGTTTGTIADSPNTVYGDNPTEDFNIDYDPVNDQMVVGRFADDIITIFRNREPSDAAYDFDGDGRSDVSIFRPGNGQWWIDNSSEGPTAAQFGAEGDKPIGADFDGDGRADISVWRPGPPDVAALYILNSSDLTVRIELFGQEGDDPVLMGDWDGDGKADPAIYRDDDLDGSGRIYYRRSGANPSNQISNITFGSPGDRAIKGDFDGDGTLDPAIYRPSDRRFWIQTNETNVLQLGSSGDIAFASDYSGDGKADPVVYRPSTGVWYVYTPENQLLTTLAFGGPGFRPVPGDYDGDGRTDIAVFRASDSTWWIRSDDGSARFVERFGIAGDIAMPATLSGQPMP